MSANLPEDLSGRQSAEAEALERHTVFSTCVRAEALEQQKAEALKQQEAEALAYDEVIRFLQAVDGAR